MFGKALFVALLAIVSYKILYFLYVVDVFKTPVFNQEPGPCRIIPGMNQGSEDIVLLQNGLAFISSGALMELYGKDTGIDPRLKPPNFKGKMYLFDFNNDRNNAKELEIIGDIDRSDFFPHGLSHWEDKKTGELRLFVVNHFLNLSSSIMIFKYEEKKNSLKFIKSILDPLIYSPNDLVAIGPEEFYVTNDRPLIPALFKSVCMILLVPWSNVVFYDGKNASLSADNFRMANGIAASPDLKYIYVNDVAKGKIGVYERGQDNSLTLIQDIYDYYAGDNLYVDPNGDIWTAGNPILYTFFEHIKNTTNLAPTQVLRIRPGSTKAPYNNYEIRQVYMNDGKDISSGSIAVFYQGKLLIGSIVDTLVLCEVKAF